MNKIGHVLDFTIESNEIPGSITVGRGAVQLINGIEVRYSDGYTLTGLAPGTHRLYFVDAKLQDSLTDPLGLSKYNISASRFLKTELRSSSDYKLKADEDLTLKRGVYPGGMVVISNNVVIPRTVGANAEARIAETLALMVRVFVRETKKPLYGDVDSVNIKQVAILLKEEAKGLMLDHGFAEATLRQRLTDAVEALKDAQN